MRGIPNPLSKRRLRHRKTLSRPVTKSERLRSKLMIIQHSFPTAPAKPVTIAVPARKKWEGLSVDRANLAQPGLITVDKGKVFGEGDGYTLEPGSIRRAFEEWRSLCISNRMQHSLLSNRLHSIKQKVRDLISGDSWETPSEPANQNGPLSRPHLNN